MERHANASKVPVELQESLFEHVKDNIFRIADVTLSTRLTTSECKNKLLSFLCAYYYKPCDLNSTDAMAIWPTANECREIRDDLCYAEWKLLELSEYASLNSQLVPNCSTFGGSDPTIDNRLNVSCNEQFGLFCDSLCLPLCKKFSQNSDGITLLQDILFIFAAVTSLIGGTIVIIIAIYRRNSM